MNLLKLTDELKTDEGLRLFPYTDTVGKVTIGYGHNLTDNGITDTQAGWLLHDDIVSMLASLTSALPWLSTLDDARQRVLANMAFNMGLGTLLSFHKMLAACEAQNFYLAASEMLHSHWASQVGGRAIRLANQMRLGGQ